MYTAEDIHQDSMFKGLKLQRNRIKHAETVLNDAQKDNQQATKKQNKTNKKVC